MPGKIIEYSQVGITHSRGLNGAAAGLEAKLVLQKAFPVKPRLTDDTMSTREEDNINLLLLECARAPTERSETEQALRRMLFDVTCCQSIDELPSSLGRSSVYRPVDVVLLDLSRTMSESSAVDADASDFDKIARTVRISRSYNAPVLVLSTHRRVQWLCGCTNAGARDVIIKPVDGQRDVFLSYGRFAKWMRRPSPILESGCRSRGDGCFHTDSCGIGGCASPYVIEEANEESGDDEFPTPGNQPTDLFCKNEGDRSPGRVPNISKTMAALSAIRNASISISGSSHRASSANGASREIMHEAEGAGLPAGNSPSHSQSQVSIASAENRDGVDEQSEARSVVGMLCRNEL